jgi:hypothetical protein
LWQGWSMLLLILQIQLRLLRLKILFHAE